MNLILLRKCGKENKHEYGKLQEVMLKGTVEEYYTQFYSKSKQTKANKVQNDLASSIWNIPGSKLGRRLANLEEAQVKSGKKLYAKGSNNTADRKS